MAKGPDLAACDRHLEYGRRHHDAEPRRPPEALRRFEYERRWVTFRCSKPNCVVSYRPEALPGQTELDDTIEQVLEMGAAPEL